MPKLDLTAFAATNATGYPQPHAAEIEGRWYRRLGPQSGLSQFGVSHVTLKPGAWSSHRHWHEGEDEFVVMLAGQAWLVEDDGEQLMNPGDCAAFPAGESNGHVLQNRSEADCLFVAIGRPSASDCHYPDIDLHLFAGHGFRRKDGSPF